MLDDVKNRDMIPAWIDGQLTPVEKLDVHKRGLRHKAVSVFVVRGKDVLIQRRALSKYHTPGLWANTCCTHPLWDEDPATCAVRRLEEELGITGLVPAHKGHIEYRAEVGNDLIEHESVEVFLAEVHGPLALNPNPDEVMETRWISIYDLAAEAERRPERFTPWLRIYLADHMDAIFA